MLLQPPNIDERSVDQIIEEIRLLAPFYTAEWNARDKQEAGTALIQNFAQLVFDIIQHLNRTPAKNFFEFLSRLGIALQPARPARAPVTFLLATGTPEDVLVPARTQAAAEATDTRPEVVFETERNLLATTATLQAVYSAYPPEDEIFEHLTALNTSTNSELFGGKNLQEHSIYFGHSELLDLKAEAEIKVQMIGVAPGLTAADFINGLSWEWWNKDHWVPSTVPAFKESFDDFPAVVTLQRYFPVVDTDDVGIVVATTEVASDERFPNRGLLLIEDEVFGYETKEVNRFRGFPITNQIPGANRPQSHAVGVQIRAIDNPLFVDATVGNSDDGRQRITVTLKKTFDAEFTKTKVNDIENIWIRCQTLRSSPLKRSPFRNLTIDTIQASTGTLSNQRGRPPVSIVDALFYNDVPLESGSGGSNSFHPFGKQPRPFDAFYIASKDSFSKTGADVTIKLNIRDNKVPATPAISPASPAVIWEYWNGSGWVNLQNSNTVGDFLSATPAEKTLSFAVPSDMQETNVSGQQNYWIRARIVGGSYGGFVVNPGNVAQPNFTFPEVTNIAITYTSKPTAFENCLVYNNLNYKDQSKDSRSGGTLFSPFQAPEEDQPTLYLGFDKPLVSGPIGIFFSLVKQDYLKEFKPRLQWQYWNGIEWVFLDVLDETDNLTSSGLLQLVGPEDLLAREKFGAKLVWIRAVDLDNRFVSPTASALVALPGIAAISALPRFSKIVEFLPFRISNLVRGIQIASLSRAGLQATAIASLSGSGLQAATAFALTPAAFSEPTPPTSAPVFALPEPCPELLELFHPRFSLPAALSQFPPPPILRGISPNTMWAIQAETIRNEILGSSDGQANQRFRPQRASIVSEEIWVNEINGLLEEERIKLVEQNPKLIEEVRDEKGVLSQVWVRWNSVKDFFDSTSTSRDYIIDRVQGVLEFGDGVNGMIPPIGIDNIRANYQFGGGTVGNVKVGTLVSLKTSVAGVDKVTNPEPAGGGADTEILNKVLERGPQIIKHRNRAIAREDFEWLARQASSDIAKVRCLPTTNQNGEFETGWVAVIIVPQGQEAQPVPSAELIRQVKLYLTDRCPNVVSIAEKLIVTGPAYVEVTVTAEVFATSIDLISQVQNDTVKSLRVFLHPLNGGPDREGWDLGRLVCLSDIIASLEAQPNVDHVDNVTMQLRDVLTSTVRIITDDVLLSATLPPYALIFSGEHQITVKFQPTS